MTRPVIHQFEEKLWTKKLFLKYSALYLIHKTNIGLTFTMASFYEELNQETYLLLGK